MVLPAALTQMIGHFRVYPHLIQGSVHLHITALQFLPVSHS